MGVMEARHTQHNDPNSNTVDSHYIRILRGGLSRRRRRNSGARRGNCPIFINQKWIGRPGDGGGAWAKRGERTYSLTNGQSLINVGNHEIIVSRSCSRSYV